ncbi:Oxysterol-binding protein like protein [Aduncisulcus paluster]|uniref:Oxysterol-binding protein like protein n=1 Tax=Aduncisulcus paluster TaxID=2918883 RepID=A0ABQ5KVB5_9EUKA|nr:Oxysterol-binding protein like protein [Aduncisulcus paluster]
MDRKETSSMEISSTTVGSASSLPSSVIDDKSVMSGGEIKCLADLSAKMSSLSPQIGDFDKETFHYVPWHVVQPYNPPCEVKSGGVVNEDEDIVRRHKAVIFDIVKQIGKNLIRFKNIISVSLPVVIFEPRSLHQRIADNFAYIDFLHRSNLRYKQSPSDLLRFLPDCYKDHLPMNWEIHPEFIRPIQRYLLHSARFLDVICFAISALSIVPRCHRKPFNPVLGETWSAEYPGTGCRVYFEQATHHPPASRWILRSRERENHERRGFEFIGVGVYWASLGAANLKGGQKGFSQVSFFDDDESKPFQDSSHPSQRIIFSWILRSRERENHERRGFEFIGVGVYWASLGAANLKGGQKGFSQVSFFDDDESKPFQDSSHPSQRIIFSYPAFHINNLFFGQRVCYMNGSMQIVDPDNGFVFEITMDKCAPGQTFEGFKDGKCPVDNFAGQITHYPECCLPLQMLPKKEILDGAKGCVVSVPSSRDVKKRFSEWKSNGKRQKIMIQRGHADIIRGSCLDEPFVVCDAYGSYIDKLYIGSKSYWGITKVKTEPFSSRGYEFMLSQGKEAREGEVRDGKMGEDKDAREKGVTASGATSELVSALSFPIDAHDPTSVPLLSSADKSSKVPKGIQFKQQPIDPEKHPRQSDILPTHLPSDSDITPISSPLSSKGSGSSSSASISVSPDIGSSARSSSSTSSTIVTAETDEAKLPPLSTVDSFYFHDGMITPMLRLPRPIEECLHSDSRFRLDLLALGKGDEEESQKQKEILENERRRLRKLRRDGDKDDLKKKKKLGKRK